MSMEAVPRPYFYYNTEVPEAQGLKLALDTPADFEKIESMIRSMDKDHTHYQLREITELATNL